MSELRHYEFPEGDHPINVRWDHLSEEQQAELDRLSERQAEVLATVGLSIFHLVSEIDVKGEA